MVYFRYFLASFEVLIDYEDIILINIFVSQVGIQTKPADLKIKTSNLVEVNVLNDQVCNVLWIFSGHAGN